MSVNESILSLALITVELDYSRFNSMTRNELKEYLFNYLNNPNNSQKIKYNGINHAIRILLEGKKNTTINHSRSNIDNSISNIDHSRSNIDHSRSNIDHSRFNTDHSRSNIDHSRFNTDHSRFNTDHSRFNTDHSRSKYIKDENYSSNIGQYSRPVQDENYSSSLGQYSRPVQDENYSSSLFNNNNFNQNFMNNFFNINNNFSNIFDNIEKQLQNTKNFENSNNSHMQSYSKTYVNDNGNGYISEKSLVKDGINDPVIKSNYQKIINGKIINQNDTNIKYI